MNKVLSALLSAVAALSFCATAHAEKSPADYINPFIGCCATDNATQSIHGLGKTFPGATTPFGMTQVSPQTVHGGDKAPGYSTYDQTIEGFAITQMSGVGWFGDLGNFLVMPTTGPLKLIPGKEDGSITGGYRSFFDKATETAKAGYYSVHLTDYDIQAETTASTHCAAMRFTFPSHKQSRIQIDLARRVAGSSEFQYVKILDDHSFEGWIRCTPNGGGWGNGKGAVAYTIYFHAETNMSLRGCKFWSADIPDTWERKRDEVDTPEYQYLIAKAPIIKGAKELSGKNIGLFNEFKTKAGDQVVLKIGISFVDIEGARLNYAAEMDGKSFDEIRQGAFDMWNAELDRLLVEGGTDDEKTVFYTCMYHSMIDPRIFTDVDGRYVGGDGNIVNTDGAFTKRTIFSGWDVFRSQFPLHCIINPEMVNDEINSLVTLAEQSRRFYFERWEHFNSYSGCMIGNPALSVLADAYVKGIRGYDIDKAYQYGKNTAFIFGNGELGYTPDRKSISYTLEYSYFDWCMSQLASALGKDKDAEEFQAKSRAYRNLFREDVGWFCPRKADGSWEKWPSNGRLRQGFGCTESNPYQQGWFVPQDVPGMVELMGGRDAVVADLEEFFEKVPESMLWNDYYNHANEPVHFVPFLFNQLDVPWLTQKWSRQICTRAYHNSTEGLVGNEDAGQMSAWYILTASGIHPSCPGNTRYEITSPVFERASFRLDPKYTSGGRFTIIAHDNSPENIYIQRALLNGKPYGKCWIDFADIAAGSTLELFMGPKPNKSWGVEQ